MMLGRRLLIGLLGAFCMLQCQAVPQLAGQAELTGGGALKIRPLAQSHGLPAPTPEAHYYTLTMGSDVRRVKWYAVGDLWRERAFVGMWRDRKGNEMTLARVLSTIPEIERGLGEREEIEKALDDAQRNFTPDDTGKAAWLKCWNGGGRAVGRFAEIKDVGTFYVEFSFVDDVSQRDAQKLLKTAASSLSAKTAGVSAANTSMKWWSQENEQYVFLTNLDRAKGGKFIADAMKLMTAMRKSYEAHVPPQQKIGKCKVRVFKTLADYREYLRDSDSGDMAFSCGMWDPTREELLIAAEDVKDAQQTMRHEAFHQYLFYATGRGNHALWFNEGFATLFENVKYNPAKKTVAILGEGNRAAWVARDPAKIAAHMRSVINMDRSQYYSGDVNLNYVTGWAVMYFLDNAPKVSEDFAPYKSVVPTYLREMKAGRTAAEATTLAWQHVYGRDIGADFMQFWRNRRKAK